MWLEQDSPCPFDSAEDNNQKKKKKQKVPNNFKDLIDTTNLFRTSSFGRLYSYTVDCRTILSVGETIMNSTILENEPKLGTHACNIILIA